ncbi:O-phosphoseryl-tRNA(Sec) selenium transferase [Cyclospora cayetanensis]|uniref:O-phosphoseryl-tRNA(Sec) selenium transferase n=1 Tax=Cyclospora cayetanensis TaxID=88456 RepID=A0A6P6S1Y8_9EIME|nr:O-phosphoseryl-tRNA(Sec) selenium transferase [Cyclospora cayetanensis]
MEKASFDAVEDLLSPSYCRVAREVRRSWETQKEKKFLCVCRLPPSPSGFPGRPLPRVCARCGAAAYTAPASPPHILLSQRQLPEAGWTSLQIEHLLLELAATDANNQPDQASVGEREGHIFALQPKAVGSSLSAARCLPVPIATGMSMSAMTAEAHRLLCVISTTSAFAPRQPDMILQIAQLCKKMGVFHLVNNAYGLQCSKCCALVEQGCSAGRVDLVVSSCDKNFLTPVGGALIYGPAPELVSRVSACYPGRASISPILDLLITLLEMGKVGLKQLLRDRKELFAWFKEELTTLCASLGLRVLPSPRNKISIAVDLSTLKSEAYEDRGPSFLGSQLFFRRCSGLRVVTPSAAATQLAGISLQSFGSHCRFPVPYCAMACAIGAKKEELQLFLQRFGRLIGQARNTSLPVAPPHQAETEEPRSGDRHPSAKEEERQYSEGETS